MFLLFFNFYFNGSNNLLASNTFPFFNRRHWKQVVSWLRVKLRNTCWVDLTVISQFLLHCFLVHTLLPHPLHYDVCATIEFTDFTTWLRTNSPRKGKRHVLLDSWTCSSPEGKTLKMKGGVGMSCMHTNLHCLRSTSCTPQHTIPGIFRALALVLVWFSDTLA